jgi:hypothetical protein
MKWPDFIICGFMKCGTTVLWRNLNLHPGITMGKNPDDPKKKSTEIRFWNNGSPHRTWKRGTGWYRSLFSDTCSGEKCANYVESSKAMERIASHVPGIKIIIMVRNPVDRAYSEYSMQLHTAPGKNSRGFLKATQDHPSYLKKGRYLDMLKSNVLPFFERSDLMVVVQEQMYADTRRILAEIHGFLGVEQCKKGVEDISFKDRDSKTSTYRRWQSGYQPMNSRLRRRLLVDMRRHNLLFFDWLGYEIPEWNN